MNAHIKHMMVTIGFVTLLVFVMVSHVVSPDKSFSENERRNLKRFNPPTHEMVFDRDYSDSLETYLLDQFIFREKLRGVNAMSRLYLFNQHDVNGLFVRDGHIHELMYSLDRASFQNAVSLMAAIKDAHFESVDTYHTYIPDKNRYLDDDSVPVMDYTYIKETLQDPGFDSQYVDLASVLKRDHYYRTDHHWRQERLVPVANVLLDKMGEGIISSSAFDIETRAPFHGVYHGQLALPLDGERMRWLVSDTTDQAYRLDPISGETAPVYERRYLDDVDPYQLFLGGDRPVTELHTENSASDRHLVIFGDSFTNSLAPLLLEEYSKVTFVDLRHISPDIVDEYIEGRPDALLFMYSTHILNDSWMLN